ncbi:MAG: DNA mismatch repair endonuclease MutL [Alkalimonas sp.]|nr:DNA mismatch repair endonuclease MutL [Alkalimonas sp.]
MPIQILPPQLANQIAAGEVVERPASVVKELVENALDAGASQIDIDIEKGGARLIRVRDNGCGIAQQELTLALSRHATSKIGSLDDLEHIISLGFRGEALASISSVARLILTSRPDGQEAAWQASAEGRDMQVQIKPAAHPIGSSVEVQDLFFNTPARRKFLRTEKTEFSHIDELIKRLALSRFDVGWTLTHNGQSVRRLKPATTAALQLKRVASLCGRAFAEHACWIESQHQELTLWGWVLPPSAIEQQGCQYSYVNGRMMRDKLLNHAIRQAYGERLADSQQPVFVLYLELPAHDVDVNVHPAKHEVRFHQARLVHDFVVSALSDALQQLAPLAATDAAASSNDLSDPSPKPGSERHFAHGSASGASTGRSQAMAYNSAHSRPSQGQVGQQLHYLAMQEQSVREQSAPVEAGALLSVHNRFWLQTSQDQLQLVSLAKALVLHWQEKPQQPRPLLVPLRLKLAEHEQQQLQQVASWLVQLGMDVLLHDTLAIIRAVPKWLQRSPLERCFLPFCLHLAEHGQSQQVLMQAVDLLLKAHWVQLDYAVQCYPSLQQQPPEEALVGIDLSTAQDTLEASFQ